MRKWMTVLALALAGAGCIGKTFDAGGEAGGAPGEEAASTEPPEDGDGGGDVETDRPGDLYAEGNGLLCQGSPAEGAVSLSLSKSATIALVGGAVAIALVRRLKGRSSLVLERRTPRDAEDAEGDGA